ncbi:related to SMP3 - alpha 1,2-mannosyltransferase involved in glycosyl phosphatidyl inositol biosynthesis [Melanopsichium pennsylvanicum]|uniref:Mannosyltransferase n=1 Tax=Melanopsichium pennsylvanicum TaxID=63383 RepID=A0AAJ4XSK8_9BASI|nr:related to SMP3 - alpha 1,2-mannosyltransferase involved in glycosyl phosphatidyl inositol biosynthesis [Melanopsichium pennsylvanicum]
MLFASLRALFDPRTRTGKVYLALLLIRFYSAFCGYGYIHPDEWMQSGEPFFGITQFNIAKSVPWEWSPDTALRSFSSLRSMQTDLLLYLYKTVSPNPISGYGLFLIQRAAMLPATLCLDFYIAITFPETIAPYILSLYGISTAATTFMVRTFSNASESHNLGLLLLFAVGTLTHRDWYTSQSQGWIQCAAMAFPAILSVDGFFYRFTFPIFALPIAIFLLYCLRRIYRQGDKRKAARLLAVGLATTTMAFYTRTSSETTFYTNLAKVSPSNKQVAYLGRTKWVVPPINALLYNMRTENVKQHGLHPRWLHTVVNLPMMIGLANFLVLFIYGLHYFKQSNTTAWKNRALVPSSEKEERQAVEQAIKNSLLDVALSSSSWSSSQAAKVSASMSAATATDSQGVVEGQEQEVFDTASVAIALCFAVIIFSLIMLSISPHQEARFLLPLCLPASIIFAYALQSPLLITRPRLSRALMFLHVIQHLLQMGLFSFLHQACLLPVLFSIDESISSLSKVGESGLMDRFESHLVYRTFDVPFHLLPNQLRLKKDWRIEHYTSCTELGYVVDQASKMCDDSWIYAPSWVRNDLEKAAQEQGKIRLELEQTWSGHIDMDHLVETWQLVKKNGLLGGNGGAISIHKLAVRCKIESQHHSVNTNQIAVSSNRNQNKPLSSSPHQDL